MGAKGAPPQWAGDPTGRHHLRYWDGTAWTEHVADARGVTGVDPFAPTRPQARRCGRCGEPTVGDSSGYCVACGEDLRTGRPARAIPVRPAPRPASGQRNWTVGIAVIAGLAIAIVVVAVWASGRFGHNWTASQRQIAQAECQRSAARDGVSIGVSSGICSCVVDVLEDRYPSFGDFEAGSGANAEVSLELISRCLP